jgi:phage terminase large subunit-like protein
LPRLDRIIEREHARLQAAKPKLVETPDESLVERYDWKKHARAKQLLPEGLWRFWLILAGRNFGKTRTGAESCIQWAREKPGSVGALIGQTPGEVDGVMVNGALSGIMDCSPPWFRPVWTKSTGPGKAGTLTWPNGTVAYGFSASNPDSLRGPQFHWGWGDELAKWRYATKAFDMFNLALRLPGFGAPQAIFTTTPRPIPIIHALLKRSMTVVTRGSTYENEANTAPEYLQELLTQYERTRLGRQELDAEVLEDLAGALWSLDQLEQLRLEELDLSTVGRIVVGVDPSGGSEEGNDEQGIIVAGKRSVTVKGKAEEQAVVLDDRSCRLTPDGWGRRTVQAVVDYGADCVVAESNFGGEMVEFVVKTAAEAMGVTVRVELVHASRGKHVRAEPISSLYEQRRVMHLGQFADLEDELTQFTPEGYQGTSSPNHADAAVWALTRLMLGSKAAGYGDLPRTAGSWGRVGGARWGRARR